MSVDKSITGQESQWQQQYPTGYDYSSYYAAWQNYHNQSQYYAYDPNYASYGANYQYPPPPPQPTADPTAAAVYPPPPPNTADPQATTEQASEQQASASEYYDYASYESTESTVEEHEIPLDVDRMNEDAMARNNDFYDALEDSRWLPNDGLDPSYAKLK